MPTENRLRRWIAPCLVNIAALAWIGPQFTCGAQQAQDESVSDVSVEIETNVSGVELREMNRENWRELAIRGKEVDAIYGDYVLRNQYVSLVVATPLETRHANLAMRRIGGCVLDLVSNDKPNDQLSCFFPLASRYLFVDPEGVEVSASESSEIERLSDGISASEQIDLRLRSSTHSDGSYLELTYRLTADSRTVEVITKVVNASDNTISIPLRDRVRADRSFQFGIVDDQLFWAYDEWFRAAYGVVALDRVVRRASGGVTIEYADGESADVSIAPGESHSFTRWIFPGRNVLDVRGTHQALKGVELPMHQIEVTDPAGTVGNVRLVFKQGDVVFATARTDSNGQLAERLPDGQYTIDVAGIGRPPVVMEIDSSSSDSTSIELEACGYVRVTVTDADGGELPCKVSFYGEDGTPDPFFGPDSKATGVHNTRYTPSGKFRQQLSPGKYQVVISRGPEYDALFESIEVVAGEVTRVRGQLSRVIETSGWVSTEYHSHSSPSGDNTSSQPGRVLNLLAEHIEFAPCTEHNRVSSYMPHLRRFNATHWMATCPGIELTGALLPVNHQNSFPLRHQLRRQNGGGPDIDADPVVQIERLAMWDQGSDKIVQTNHPNLIQILGDSDNDRVPDEGFRDMFQYMDVIEIHPLDSIFQTPTEYPPPDNRGNAIFCWMQLINQGYRIPGCVNTDAHYNFHGSGWIRNYVKSSTDDPAEISIDEMVTSTEHGNLIMTTGPYLEVMVADQADQLIQAIAGEDLIAESGEITIHVRVQCANWLDINRVQVFVNGRMDETMNFTRRTHPDMFDNGVVKFDNVLSMPVAQDSHIIVAVAGEDLQLGRVMGPSAGARMPIAVNNPIFVDVDGNGFEANGDLLGGPLPLEDVSN